MVLRGLICPTSLDDFRHASPVRSTTFLVSYDMPKVLLCLPDDQAKVQMSQIMLKAMHQVILARTIVSSKNYRPETCLY